MDDRPPIPLEYSSVAEDQKRQEEREHERREALDEYNESTFGERHPHRNAFIRAAIWIGVFSFVTFVARGSLGSALGHFVGFLLISAIATVCIVFLRIRRG